MTARKASALLDRHITRKIELHTSWCNCLHSTALQLSFRRIGWVFLRWPSTNWILSTHCTWVSQSTSKNWVNECNMHIITAKLSVIAHNFCSDIYKFNPLLESLSKCNRSTTEVYTIHFARASTSNCILKFMLTIIAARKGFSNKPPKNTARNSPLLKVSENSISCPASWI